MAAATDEGEIVKSVIEEVRERLGKGDALTIALEHAGYAGKGANPRYSASVVSSWVTGRAVPGADVFLAAAKLVNISLDEYLYEEAGTDRRQNQRLARVERKVEAVEQKLADRLDALTEAVEELAKVVEAAATAE